MNAADALIFAFGIYALTLVVALFVVVVIVGIRRITADRPKAPVPGTAASVQKEEATA